MDRIKEIFNKYIQAIPKLSKSLGTEKEVEMILDAALAAMKELETEKNKEIEKLKDWNSQLKLTVDILDKKLNDKTKSYSEEDMKDFAYKLGGRYNIHLDKYFKSHVNDIINSPIKEQEISKEDKYKCDRCPRTYPKLDEVKVKNKQHYVSPHGCSGGDYYVDAYYWFECECGRCIEVDKKDLSKPNNAEKDFTAHRGVNPLKNK